jgi:hypothetical protein
MAYQSIGIGTTADDGTGDSLRIGADKVNDNFVELYTLLGDGSALSSGLSASATVITLGSPVINTPTIAGVVSGTQTSATITTLATTTVNGTTLNAGTMAVAAGSITDSSGAISFGNENLTTTGTLAAGNITVGNIISTGSSIVLEGSTPNGNETTLTVTDPTGDRTITFPDATGTVLTTGDSNTVTGTIIAADTVAEANMADDAIGSAQLKTLSTLLIKNSGGSTLKTIHGAGA